MEAPDYEFRLSDQRVFYFLNRRIAGLPLGEHSIHEDPNDPTFIAHPTIIAIEGGYSRERNELYFFTTKARIRGSQWAATAKRADDLRGVDGQILGTKKRYRHKNNISYKWYLDVYQISEQETTVVKFYESSRGMNYIPPFTREQWRQVREIVSDTLSHLGSIAPVASEVCNSSVSNFLSQEVSSAPQSAQCSQHLTMEQIRRIRQIVWETSRHIAPDASEVCNSPLSQEVSSAPQSARCSIVKFWEGNLVYSGRRQGPVVITRLQGYRSASMSETLAANWPPTLQIVKLLYLEPLNNRLFVCGAVKLVFRILDQHESLRRLQEEKLCALIELTSQTLILYVAEEAFCLVGVLYPSVISKLEQRSGEQQQLTTEAPASTDAAAPTT